MKIAVIDGQGGGVGKSLVVSLKERYGSDVEIIALGTNALATSAMLKAGADQAATGENAVVFNASKVDLITGPIGIILGNSMLGELTPVMAAAIGGSPCEKILVPVQKCNITVAGNDYASMQLLIEDVVRRIGMFLQP